jgi:hypothetical protein
LTAGDSLVPEFLEIICPRGEVTGVKVLALPTSSNCAIFFLELSKHLDRPNSFAFGRPLLTCASSRKLALDCLSRMTL